MRGLRVALLTVLVVPFLVAVEPARAADECEGLQVCISVPGPWVVVPARTAQQRPSVQYQLTCPRGHVVGGLDAELSQRGIDVGFLGRLGSPVTPGVTTARSAVFVASFVGTSPRAPTFRPFIGCVPAAGGGGRVPTSLSAFQPGQPTTRRVRTVRVRPGTATVTQRCTARERLVGAAHAVGFYRRTPPGAGLVATVTAMRAIRAGRVVVSVRGDAELGGVRAVVQVQALCARVR